MKTKNLISNIYIDLAKLKRILDRRQAMEEIDWQWSIANHDAKHNALLIREKKKKHANS